MWACKAWNRRTGKVSLATCLKLHSELAERLKWKQEVVTSSLLLSLGSLGAKCLTGFYWSWNYFHSYERKIVFTCFPTLFISNCNGTPFGIFFSSDCSLFIRNDGTGLRVNRNFWDLWEKNVTKDMMNMCFMQESLNANRGTNFSSNHLTRLAEKLEGTNSRR